MKGLILSGGKGTRLQPLTYTLAKQLVPVANKPVLFRVIETIRDAGVSEIGIIIAPQTGEEIKRSVGDGSRFGVNITYILQEEARGLAHAVLTAHESGFLGRERFAMFLGDNVIQGGISNLIRDFADHEDWNAQIVLKEVTDPRSYGVAALNPDGSINHLVEKPQDPPSNLALVGIYMFDGNIIDAVRAIEPSWRNEYEITDAIQWLLTHGHKVFPHIHQGWWIDTGKPLDMLEANSAVLEELVPYIAPDAVIENSTVDRRVTVEAGARIINSTVRGPTIIGAGTVVENSFVGPFTSIYHHVVMNGCEIERSIVLEETSMSNLNGRIQDSLIGRKVVLERSLSLPRTLQLNVGDNSSIKLV